MFSLQRNENKKPNSCYRMRSKLCLCELVYQCSRRRRVCWWPECRWKPAGRAAGCLVCCRGDVAATRTPRPYAVLSDRVLPLWRWSDVVRDWRTTNSGRQSPVVHSRQRSVCHRRHHLLCDDDDGGDARGDNADVEAADAPCCRLTSQNLVFLTIVVTAYNKIWSKH